MACGGVVIEAAVISVVKVQTGRRQSRQNIGYFGIGLTGMPAQRRQSGETQQPECPTGNAGRGDKS